MVTVEAISEGLKRRRRRSEEDEEYKRK